VVDTEAPPIYFQQLPPQSATMLGLQPQEIGPTMTPDGPLPAQPLSPESAMKIQQAITAGQLPPTSLITINTASVCDYFQDIFDVIWNNRSDPEEWYYDNTLLNNIDGWCPSTYEFDDEKKRHIITDLPIRQFFCDPTTYDVNRMAWVIVDIVYRADVAKALFPDFAEDIDDNLTQVGRIERPPNTLLMGSQYEDVSIFQTAMVTLTVMFLRDQLSLYEPAEAIKQGILEKRTVGTGNWKQAPREDAPDHMEEEQREGLFHADTGEEHFPPGHPDHEPNAWPKYRCLRQLTMIAARGKLIGDAECKYWDIPIALNINIPVIGKPVGIGEPFRHRTMQDARSRNLTAMSDHSEVYKSATTWAPKSARELLPEEFKDSPSIMGAHLWIDDETVKATQGKIMGVIDPPALPPVHMLIDDKLKREINDSGGNMAAIQGQPSEHMANLSGVAIAQIQQGASSLASFKAKRMQQVINRTARLALHSILTRMKPKDWYKISRRFPMHVLELLATQILPDLEWSIRAKVSSGTGTTLAQKKAEAKDDFKTGLISKVTAQEACGRDPQLEEQRQQQEAAQQAQAQMQMAARMPQGQQQQSPPQGANP
jgi:hypothetical protein